MDRTVATGTGYIGQYRPAVARIYESLATCPDDLLLFMHHVPYTYVLHDGKTVIQYIYDSHYDGAEAVEEYVRDWQPLDGAGRRAALSRRSGAARISGRPGGSLARRGHHLVRHALPASPMRKAAWAITPAASKPKPCNSKATRCAT